MLLSLLATQPVWLSSILLVGMMSLVAMIGPVVVRRRVALNRLRRNNEVAGFLFATIGVLYAVLLGFAVISAWEKFSDAENIVAQEAAAVATLYRLAEGIGGDPGMALRAGLDRYIKAAVAEDWPAMEHGEGSHAVTETLSATYRALLTFAPSDSRGAALLEEALHQLDTVTQNRRTRLVMAPGIIPRVLWFVLSGGAVVTIGFTLFFGTESLRVQVIMTAILSFLIFSGLLIITAIDRPFAGTVKVRPDALLALLEDFRAAAPPQPPSR
ncbi:hypothetical protein [Microvirga sp. TS319]|uniref:bestrophin-like domain n=1 Tax=Microvirga sp. TS319 TaxID=3241165 RepID=UPI00351A4FFD